MGKDRYAPGELSRVRERLGPVDWQEAKTLADKLGGEVGYERSHEDEVKQDKPVLPSRPKRRIETALEHEKESKKKLTRPKGLDPLDDPALGLKPSFADRLKMDRFAAQSGFEIKSPIQIVQMMMLFFTKTPDTVSTVFIKQRMPEYYKKIETLVVPTRSMFPRNNTKRNEQLKKASPLSYAVLDVIRYWDIERISTDLAKIQSRPKNVLVSEFSEIIKAVYKPLFLLEKMDSDVHIRASYKELYKILYLENPSEAKGKSQNMIHAALASFFEIRRDIRLLLYPLFLKLVSSKFVHYSHFFEERKNRIMAFLGVTEENKLDPALLPLHGAVKNAPAAEEDDPLQQEENAEEAKAEDKDADVEIPSEEQSSSPIKESEQKAYEKGIQTLEALFPKAGWERLDKFPDLYPYFMDTLDLKRGVVYIAPTDPLLQILILMRTLEELFFGMRSVSFGTVTGAGGVIDDLRDSLGGIINGWRHDLEISIGNEYLPRMIEYIRILEGSMEERISPYTRKIVSEMHWIKRLYLMPYYKFETIAPPSFQRKGIEPIYTKIKNLRKYLSIVAAGIDKGNRAGGAEAKAVCEGIDNPWDSYVFQVPNPLSIRLNALLPQKSRNNASLIYFCLAITIVLDQLVNNEKSWAYSSEPGPLFRSVDGEGISPLTGVDERIDADALFKESIQRKKQKKG